MQIQKGEHIPNKANIIIKDAWLDFSVSNKKTYPYIFINEYELLNENKVEEEKDYYEQMGKEIEIDENELPFQEVI